MWGEDIPKPWTVEHEKDVPEFWQDMTKVDAEEDGKRNAPRPDAMFWLALGPRPLNPSSDRAIRLGCSFARWRLSALSRARCKT